MEAFAAGAAAPLSHKGATPQTPSSYCCECGVPMEKANPTNTCVVCLSSRVDVTAGLPRVVNVFKCRRCGQYLAGNEQWVQCEPESKELMALCLKKVRGLGKAVRAVDCAWIWTEPNSMRLKLKLTVQKEVASEAVLQKSFHVEFVVKNQQCSDCAANFNNMSWTASVQVRQRVSHKRTFFYLEQLILKKNAQARAVKIEQFRDGLDFFFKEKNDAVRFATFLEDCVPCKAKTTKKLVSADLSSNLFFHQYTALVELAKPCKDDLVLLSAADASRRGVSRLLLVKAVNQALKLVDPATARLNDLDADAYFRSPPDVLVAADQLVDFVVLDVSVKAAKVESSSSSSSSRRHVGADSEQHQKKNKKKRRRQQDTQPHRVAKGFVAEVTLAREKDLGVNDDKRFCVTHLGALLRAGDVVKGYDLTTANFPGDLDDVVKPLLDAGTTPDVVLVRKHLPDQHRKFTLRALDEEPDLVSKVHDTNTGAVSEDHDYQTFLDQLETDRDMRTNVNLYKATSALAVKDDVADDDALADPDALHVSELLDDLGIADGGHNRNHPPPSS